MAIPGLGDIVSVTDAHGDEYLAKVVAAPPLAPRGSFPKIWLEFSGLDKPLPWPASEFETERAKVLP